MAVNVEYAMDVPVGGFTSFLLLYFSRQDSEWGPEAQEAGRGRISNISPSLLTIYISYMSKLSFRERLSKSFKVTRSVKWQSQDSNSKPLPFYYISEVELGIA